MKIIIVGASGTIGTHVTARLAKQHEVIKVGSKSGDIHMDMASMESITNMYDQVGIFDALVCVAGNAYFGPFNEMSEEDFYTGIKSKMMGQINLVMAGKDSINNNGSFTLTSGILSEDPIKGGTGLSFVNGAVNSSTIAAAVELERGIRLNTVCAGLVEDSIDSYGPYFPGHTPVTMNRVTDGYIKSVEGAITGQIIRIYG